MDTNKMTDAGVSRLYEKYASTHAKRKRLANERLLVVRDIIPHLDIDNCDSYGVLDVGCGQGMALIALRECGVIDSSGVDISPEQIEIAQENGLSDRVICAPYQERMLEAGQWHAIIGTDFVEHLDKVQILEFFERAREALAPGGRLIVRCPNATSAFGGLYQFGDFTHLTYLNPMSFEQIALSCGFAKVRTFSCAPAGTTWKNYIRQVAWKALEIGYRTILATETGQWGHIVSQNFIGVAYKEVDA